MAHARAPVSLTARLAAGFVAVLVAALLGICAYLDFALQEEFMGEDRRNLGNEMAFVRQVLSAHRSFEELQSDPHNELDATVRRLGLFLALSDAHGRTIYSSYGDRWLAAGGSLRSRAQAADSPTTVMHNGRMWRVLVAVGHLGDAARTPVAVMLALDVTARADFARRYRSRLTVAAVVAAAAAGLVGLPLIRGALSPLNAMARRAGEISAARLEERLPEDSVPPELRALSVAFNHTLERLQDSFRRLSQFSSDLAHELHTPIGNLVGEAQVALRRARSAEEYQAVLVSAVEEYEHLNRMIEGMLFLARADNTQAALRRAHLDAGAEVARVAEYYEGLLAERGLVLRVQGSGSIWADQELLRRALSNLLSNAIANTPAGGTVEVMLAREVDAGVCIEVANPGPGIPPEILPHVFDRFVRVDASRNGSNRGSGLGLAIVHSIMQLHGGTAHARSLPGERTVFTLRFPPGPPEAGAEVGRTALASQSGALAQVSPP